MDRVSNLMEEVDSIIQATEADETSAQSVKSFANLALIANDLAEEFGEACKVSKEAEEESKAAGEELEPDDIDFCAAAQDLESAAERSADLSEMLNASLQEGSEPKLSDADIQNSFSEIMNTVQEGLGLYADLTDILDDEETEARP